MKKLLLTLIVSFAFCGSIFAQHPETHWPGFVYSAYEDQGALYASIMINGEPVTPETANWDVMEVAAYVGDDPENPELRMVGMYLTDEYLEYDLFPTLNAEPIYYTTPGEEVHFMMYNHETGDLYLVCEPVIWDGDPITILTGEEHWEGFDDPDHPLMLNFIGEVSTGYTLEIDPYVEAKDNYYLIASPVGEISAEAVEGLMTPSYDFYSFSQAPEDGLEWINHRDDAEYMLQPGVGYLYANNTGTDLVFTGTPLQEDTHVVELVAEGTADLDFYGWNLVGNPFEVEASLDQPFYSMVSGAFLENPAGSILPAMNGAFVVLTNEVNSVTFSKEAPAKAPSLNLNLSNNGKVIDRASVSFGQGQQLPKFQLFKNSTKVYIPMDGKDYALVNSEGMGEIPVSFKAENNGTYSLTLSSENVNFAYLHLIDNMTGADQDLLANPSYSFNANTTDYTSRFRLVFATGNDEDNFAFFSNGSLVINNEGNATLQVVDVTGRIIKCENINGCASVNIDAAPGVYMVRLVNGDNMKVQKVVK